jgi:SAM-dependent methyltransferase
MTVEGWRQQQAQEEGDRFKHEIVFPRVRDIVRHVTEARGKPIRLLDMGCGSGQIAGHLDVPWIENATLVDVNEAILHVANQRYVSRGVPTIVYRSDATELLPIKPGSIDVALASFLLNQVPYPEGILALLNSYLAPTGRLVVIVPDEAFIVRLPAEKLKEEVRGVVDVRETSYRFREAGLEAPFYHRPLTDYLKLLDIMGFQPWVERIEDPNEPMEYTPKASLFVVGKIPKKIGGRGHFVTTDSDTLSPATIRALLVREDDPLAYVVCTTGATSDLLPIPVRNDKIATSHIEKLVMSGDEGVPVLVRQVNLSSSVGGVGAAYQIFFQGKMIVDTRIRTTPKYSGKR